MTKAEYLEQLRHRLRILPESEIADALEYHEGYISDAEDEGAAIAQLGSPAEVAANILVHYVAPAPAQSGESRPADEIAPALKGMKNAWLIILALFAVPVGIPILIAVVITAFALFFALIMVVFSFALTGVVTVAVGGVMVLVGGFIVFGDFGSAMIVAGVGLICIGIGVLFVKLTLLMMRGFPAISRFVSKKIVRGVKNGRE